MGNMQDKQWHKAGFWAVTSLDQNCADASLHLLVTWQHEADLGPLPPAPLIKVKGLCLFNNFLPGWAIGGHKDRMDDAATMVSEQPS